MASAARFDGKTLNTLRIGGLGSRPSRDEGHEDDEH